MNEQKMVYQCPGGFNGLIPRCLACAEHNTCNEPQTIGMSADYALSGPGDHFFICLENAIKLAKLIDNGHPAITRKLEQNPDWVDSILEVFGDFEGELQNAAESSIERLILDDDGNPDLNHTVMVEDGITAIQAAAAVLIGLRTPVRLVK